MKAKWNILNLAVGLLLLLAIARVVVAWPLSANTSDEGPHMVTGLEWWQRGTYEIEMLHPPLSRVMAALPLYISGVRMSAESMAKPCPKTFVEAYAYHRDVVQKYTAYCLKNGDFAAVLPAERAALTRNIILARAGVLPFFILSLWALYSYARRWHGQVAATVALGIYSMMPPVLAHAGLATTDMALVAGMMLSAYGWRAYLEVPYARQAALVGLALSIAVLSKFTALMMLPLMMAVMVVALPEGRRWLKIGWNAQRAVQISVAMAVTTGMIWTMYRFSLGSPAQVIPGYTGFAADIPLIPFPEFWQGALLAMQKNQFGHARYFMGELLNRHAVWYFFPLLFLLKTPLAALGLAGMSLYRAVAGRVEWLVFVAFMLVLLTSNVNIGLRHALFVYPFFSIAVATGVAAMWPELRRFEKAAIAIFSAAGMLASLWAHPQYLSYFNILVGDKPERIVMDSDVDWGQDIFRLLDTVAAYDAAGVKVQVCTNAAQQKTLREFWHLDRKFLECPTAPNGGVVILHLESLVLQLEGEKFDWLRAFAPAYRLGGSYDIFDFR